MTAPPSVETWLAEQPGEVRATVVALRDILRTVRPGIGEHIKWNAPSFVHAGDDRITLGVERKGGVRVVLHRGVAVRDATRFRIDDPVGLAKWPRPDRGVLVFKDVSEVERRRDDLADLAGRWLDATAGG